MSFCSVVVSIQYLQVVVRIKEVACTSQCHHRVVPPRKRCSSQSEIGAMGRSKHENSRCIMPPKIRRLVFFPFFFIVFVNALLAVHAQHGFESSLETLLLFLEIILPWAILLIFQSGIEYEAFFFMICSIKVVDFWWCICKRHSSFRACRLGG